MFKINLEAGPNIGDLCGKTVQQPLLYHTKLFMLMARPTGIKRLPMEVYQMDREDTVEN